MTKVNDERAKMFLARFYPDKPPQTRFAPRNAETVHNTPHTFATPQEALASAFSGERVTLAGGQIVEAGEMKPDKKSKTRSFSTTQRNSDQLDQWIKDDGAKLSDIIHEALKDYAEKRGAAWEDRNPNPAGDASYLDEWRKQQDIP